MIVERMCPLRSDIGLSGAAVYSPRCAIQFVQIAAHLLFVTGMVSEAAQLWLSLVSETPTIQTAPGNTTSPQCAERGTVVQSFGKMGLGPRGGMPARPWGQRIGSNDKHNEWKLFIGQVPLEVIALPCLSSVVVHLSGLVKPRPGMLALMWSFRVPLVPASMMPIIRNISLAEGAPSCHHIEDLDSASSSWRPAADGCVREGCVVWWQASEEELFGLFSPIGEILELYILRNSNGKSRGCAFVTYANKYLAQQAITQLNGKQVCSRIRHVSSQQSIPSHMGNELGLNLRMQCVDALSSAPVHSL